MAAEKFFEGTTQAGRTLRLFHELIDYDVLIDVEGEPFTNPTEQSFTGTLDGEQLEIEQVRWGDETATVVTDQGTFTATTTDYEEDHNKALRGFLERRPSDGWKTAVVAKAFLDDECRYTLSVTNDRLYEQVEVRMNDKAARAFADGDLPSDDRIAEAMANDWRSRRWPDIQKMAKRPTTICWRDPNL